jgi:hypothetical protein
VTVDSSSKLQDVLEINENEEYVIGSGEKLLESYREFIVNHPTVTDDIKRQLFCEYL